MAKKIITDFSERLAKEIADRKIYDFEEISTLIQVRTSFLLRDMINEYSTEAQRDYLELLKERSKYKINSTAFLKMGYKISVAKQRKADANRAANMMGRQDDYQKLKNFVSHKFGLKVLNEFYNQKESEIPEKLPIYRT